MMIDDKLKVMKIPKLSVVIPAYNESANLKNQVLKSVSDYLKKQDYTYEVLIVDDGSTDDTAQIIESQVKDLPFFQLIRNPHGGKAQAVIAGVLKARGEVVIFTDMDQATPINQVEKLLPKFAEGYDIVIGTRHGRQGAPLIRKISALGFTVLRNLILGLPFSDTQCGFKGFNQRAIRSVFPKMKEIWSGTRSGGAAVNAGFDIETLFLAKKAGFKIAETPVEWHYVGTERVQLLKDSLEAILDMIRIRREDFNGKYN